MLKITVAPKEDFDESTNRFIMISEGGEYEFEYSLLALSKWEAKYQRAFLLENNKTKEEMLDFYAMMCLNHDLSVNDLDNATINAISDYISKKQTATKLAPSNDGNSRTIMTSERIYAYMAIAGLWLDWETRNLNTLLLTLGVIGEINSPPKKMSPQEARQEQMSINEKRRAELKAKQEARNKKD